MWFHHHASFAAIEKVEQRRSCRRASPRFDEGDDGAGVAEQLPTVEAGDPIGDLEDTQVAERRVHRLSGDDVTGLFPVPCGVGDAALAEDVLQNTTDGILRQIVGDLDVPGYGEVRQPLTAEVHERFHVDV